ncbi:hypothetical protein D3C84_554260 [compost metagenome]
MGAGWQTVARMKSGSGGGNFPGFHPGYGTGAFAQAGFGGQVKRCPPYAGLDAVRAVGFSAVGANSFAKQAAGLPEGLPDTALPGITPPGGQVKRCPPYADPTAV